MLVFAALKSGNPNATFLNQLVKIINLGLVIWVSSVLFKIYCSEDMGLNPKEIVIKFYKVLYYPGSIYVLFNVIFWLLGVNVLDDQVTNSLGTEAMILSKLGLSVTRVSFPFVTGSNTFSGIVGLHVLIGHFAIFYLKERNILLIFFQMINLIVLLLIDTRSAIILLLLVPFGILFVMKLNRPKLLLVIPFIAFAGPFLLPLMLQLISKIEFFSFLERSKGDLETGNSRLLINLISISEMIEFKPTHLLGYGEFGHYTSGKSLVWSNLFETSYNDSDIKSPHSTFFSMFFDIGYLGLIAYFFTLLSSVYMAIKTWKIFYPINLIIAAYLLYYVMIGLTETYYGFYSTIQLFHFSALILMQLVLYGYWKKNELIRISNPTKVLKKEND